MAWTVKQSGENHYSDGQDLIHIFYSKRYYIFVRYGFLCILYIVIIAGKIITIAIIIPIINV